MIGGVTVTSGGDVAFDRLGRLTSEIPGFWKPQTDKAYKVLLWDTTDKKYAIIEIGGEVRWNSQRNVVVGVETFLRIATLDNPEENVGIVHRQFVGGRLVVISADGKRFSIFNLSPEPSGVISVVD